MMIQVIRQPTQIEACGNKPKIIREYVGRINSKTPEVSVAHMSSPQGWEEPGQTPEFDEYTVVFEGTLKVKTKADEFDITAGQAVIVSKGDWVQYSTPDEACDYMAICLPAFSPNTVHRDA